MDLSVLGSTLPPGLEDAEQEMGNKFRAAAMSITHLYKTSLGYTKQAYQVGYSAALADVLSHVQGSMSAGQTPDQTLARMLDWAEARQAAMDAFAAEAEDDQLSRPPSSKPKHRSHTAVAAAHAHTQGLHRPASAPPPSSSPNISMPMSTPAAASTSMHTSTSASQAYRHAGAGPSRAQAGGIAAGANVDSGAGAGAGLRAGIAEAKGTRLKDRTREKEHDAMGSESAGPSSPLRSRRTAQTNSGQYEGQELQAEDPDQTFVQSTPASPFAHRLQHSESATATMASSSPSSPTSPSVRQLRPSRSPLRHRSDIGAHHQHGTRASSDRGDSSINTSFAPALPPLPTLNFASASAAIPHDAPDSPGVPVGSKRPAAAFDLDLDLDTDMDGNQHQPQLQPHRHLATHPDAHGHDTPATAAQPMTTTATTTTTTRQLPVSMSMSTPNYSPLPLPVAMPVPVTPTNNRQGARKRRNFGAGGEKGDEGRKGRRGGGI